MKGLFKYILLITILILATGILKSHQTRLISVCPSVNEYQSVYTVVWMEKILVFRSLNYEYFNSREGMKNYIKIMGWEYAEL